MSVDSINTKIDKIATYKESIRTAIAAKGVTIDTTVALKDYPDKIAAIETGGSSSGGSADAIFTMSQVAQHLFSGVVSDNTITTIESAAFCYWYKMTGASFANVSWIGAQAFEKCWSLSSVYLPAARKIGERTFSYCTPITNIDLPSCEVLGDKVFACCSKLSQVSLPNVSQIGTGTFYGCSLLTEISLPNCVSMAGSNFEGCSNLTSVYMPNIVSIGMYNFCDQPFSSISLPKLSAVGYYAFYGAKSTQCITLRDCGDIYNFYGFRNCWRLTSLYLLSTSVVNLGGSYAFYSSPFAGYTTYTDGDRGKIYVPESLVTAYQSATNWTYFSSLFTGLTDAEIAEIEAE